MSSPRRTITWIVNARGCHICTSHKPGSDGYPCLSVNNKRKHMHRVLYIEKFGPLDNKTVARHICDDTLCINLDHVIPGSNADNSNDAKERGRLNTPRGETRSDAKLSLAEVLIIQGSAETQSLLAQRYGLNQSTVSRIKSGKRWPDRGTEKTK